MQFWRTLHPNVKSWACFNSSVAGSSFHKGVLRLNERQVDGLVFHLGTPGSCEPVFMYIHVFRRRRNICGRQGQPESDEALTSLGVGDCPCETKVKWEDLWERAQKANPITAGEAEARWKLQLSHCYSCCVLFWSPRAGLAFPFERNKTVRRYNQIYLCGWRKRDIETGTKWTLRRLKKYPERCSCVLRS